MSLIFFDTEFSGLHQNAQLLSIALVPEKGPWFYAVFTDADLASLSPWHQKHIVPHLELSERQLAALPEGTYLKANKKEAVAALREYLITFDQVVMWADVPAYDWVLFCELFGGALSVPKNIHYIVRDLATLLEAKGYDADTDRFALAYGNDQGAANEDGVYAERSRSTGAVTSSADGRVGGEQAPAKTKEGLLRHCALGDALAGMGCYDKIMGE